MKIGIGLPDTVPGVTPDQLLDWARAADVGPFSSLGSIDQLVYSNFEPLVTLGAVAAVTQRIGLMTSVLIAPMRDYAVFAKQTATLDALSGGRLTLGMGVGITAEDFAAARVPMRGRGERFEEQLDLMKRVWNGEPIGESGRAIGPPVASNGGPEILIGGTAPRALARVGRWADGYILAVLGDDWVTDRYYRLAEESWRHHARSGKPRFLAGVYYALGSTAEADLEHYLFDFYGSSNSTRKIFDVAPKHERSVTEILHRLSDLGVDEVIFWPASADVDHLHRLADIVS
jgi:alkanesulfonate monooxygenase SsuD/methylene tetrahydromethanopterin reductase-like flavin-dependent oxidoreductase (luciferase family)